MILVRIAKIAAVFATASLFLMVFINNIVDYNSNFKFVEHVLKMDTVFQNSCCRSRAIQSTVLHHLFYWLIIASEGVTSALSWYGGYRLIRVLRFSGLKFHKEKSFAAIGLMLGFLLMVFGFITVGGEWFLMWQSEIWGTGLNAALRFAVVCGLTLLVLLQPDIDLA